MSKLFHETAREIKILTGYDRVMIYQFDEQYNGMVIAEAKEAHLSPFYELRYPASDIPKQARALFLSNQVRIIVDTQSDPAQIISGHLALQEAHDFREIGLQTNIVRSHLLEQMSRNWSVFEGLMQNKYTLLDLNQDSGAALVLDGRLHTIGECPPQEKISELISWLDENVASSVFETNELSRHWPAGEAIKNKASGLLSLKIAHTPPEYILWFRPEVIQTVNWAGNPEKAVTFSGDQQRLNPRKSFEIWKLY